MGTTGIIPLLFIKLYFKSALSPRIQKRYNLARVSLQDGKKSEQFLFFLFTTEIYTDILNI